MEIINHLLSHSGAFLFSGIGLSMVVIAVLLSYSTSLKSKVFFVLENYFFITSNRTSSELLVNVIRSQLLGFGIIFLAFAIFVLEL